MLLQRKKALGNKRNMQKMKIYENIPSCPKTNFSTFGLLKTASGASERSTFLHVSDDSIFMYTHSTCICLNSRRGKHINQSTEERISQRSPTNQPAKQSKQPTYPAKKSSKQAKDGHKVTRCLHDFSTALKASG